MQFLMTKILLFRTGFSIRVYEKITAISTNVSRGENLISELEDVLEKNCHYHLETLINLKELYMDGPHFLLAIYGLSFALHPLLSSCMFKYIL